MTDNMKILPSCWSELTNKSLCKVGGGRLKLASLAIITYSKAYLQENLLVGFTSVNH